jgi:hypothetical protein
VGINLGITLNDTRPIFGAKESTNTQPKSEHLVPYTRPTLVVNYAYSQFCLQNGPGCLEENQHNWRFRRKPKQLEI